MARFAKFSESGRRIVCLTAYDWLMAQRVAKVADIILIGDSQGMVRHGMPSTVPVPLSMMLDSVASVARAQTSALLLADLPYGSYEESPAQAFTSAAQLLKAGAGAVKLEGGAAMTPTIAFLSSRGVPVCAHLGLTPQHVNALGGYKVQGRGDAGTALRSAAEAHAQAGAFAVLLEAIPAPLAAEITNALPVPTIGIGAGAACDGQVLVTEDILGLSVGKKPKFVKAYADLNASIDSALAAFASDVRGGTFPDAATSYPD